MNPSADSPRPLPPTPRAFTTRVALFRTARAATLATLATLPFWATLAMPQVRAAEGADRAAAIATAAPRLIVRADDMGYAHAGNAAIIQTVTNGIATSVEIIAPSPWFPEAVRLLALHTNVDVGVHLALTSEWDLVKWRPLSAAPSLRDANGYLRPMIHPNRHYPGQALVENPWRIEDVEQEFRAQIELAKRHVPRLSHVSGHMGCTALNGEVRALVRRLTREYGLDIEPSDLGVRSVGYGAPARTREEKLTAFLRMLDTLQPGQSYLFVDHPGLDTPELQGIHHVGYEDVAADRQGVTDTWTHPEVKAAIRKRGIQLIGYRDLKHR